MRPASGSAIYRPDLGIVAMEFIEQAQMGYIGLQVMPLFPTPLKEATYSVIPREALLKIPDTSRAPRGSYQRSDWEYKRGLYNCSSEHGWEEPIDDTEREFFDQVAPGTADIVATKRAVNFILRSQEQRIASKVFNPTKFTAHNVSIEWSDHANSDPTGDVNDGIVAFRLQCGMLPDALIISYATFIDLRQNEKIIDRIKYTFPGLDIMKMTTSQLAQCLGVNSVLVGGAIYDSAGTGLPSVITDLWNAEYAALVKISNGVDMAQPGIGRTFLWTADSPSNPVVEAYREEKRRSDIFRCRHNTDERYMEAYDDAGNVIDDIAGMCMYLFGNISAAP